MQKEFSEKWGMLYQCMSKPIINTMALNAEVFSNLARNTNLFEDLSHLRRPEDFMAVHIKMANQAMLESAKYTQKVMQIGVEALSDMSQVLGEGFQKQYQKHATSTETGKAK